MPGIPNDMGTPPGDTQRPAIPPPREMLQEYSDLLEEIDEVLEANADEFVRAYIQRGGNGGGEYAALFESWSEALGRDRTDELLTMLGDMESHYEESWCFNLIRARYGDAAARYFLDAISELPDLCRRARERANHEQAELEGDAEPQEDNTSVVQRLIAERDLRDLITAGEYSAARQALNELITTDPDTFAFLAEEFKYLTAAEDSELHRRNSPACQVADLIGAVKLLAAPTSHGDTRTSDDIEIESSILSGDVQQEERRDMPVTTTYQQSARERGESLEAATVRLLQQVFDIPRSDTAALLARLRKQHAGLQHGHDIQLNLTFQATASNNGNSRCRVECKNYQRHVTLSDIADKLLQQEQSALAAPIDHWILISPHAEPTNELQQLVDAWHANRRFPFTVHIWSPANGLKRLLAVIPEVYRAVYGQDPEEMNDPAAVIESYLERLRPLTRIHPALERYLLDPSRMCFSNEDAGHFEELLQSHVVLQALDAAGRPLSITLRDMVSAWVDNSRSQVYLLLAEFGAGKSFFTFQLARAFAGDFLANPRRAMYPIRIPLREYRAAGSPAAFLARILERMGVTQEAWWDLTSSHPTLVLLDGFDEMSAEIDPPTVSTNLQMLVELIDYIAGPATERNAGRRLVVTSRGRFFDQPREEAALRERLRDPVIARIRPVTRTEALADLSRFAKQIGEVHKLEVIRGLYDPIGLASKPLFLQMIKETLAELPEDRFGATTLYETYIKKSLERKGHLLLSDAPLELLSAILLRLRRVLEVVAVELHNGIGAAVDLRRVEQSQGADMAALLWQMATGAGGTTSKSAEADARARVSVRSLLTPVPSPNPDEWLVTFFHRSMAEYFLASAIVVALREDDVIRTRELLRSRSLSPETIEFVSEMYSDADDGRALDRLLSVARGASVGLPGEVALGGNAISLYYALAQEFPRHAREWQGVNLDYANLNGADLRDCSFRGGSLRYAKLDNADLRGADLREADLTGLRVERTSQVDALCVDAEARTVYASYSDGLIRRWTAAVSGRWSAKTVHRGLEKRVRCIEVLTDHVALAVSGMDLLIFGRGVEQWTTLSVGPVSPFLVGIGCRPMISATSLLRYEGGHFQVLDLLDLTMSSSPVGMYDELSYAGGGDEGVIARSPDWVTAGSERWLWSTYWQGGPIGDGYLWDLSTREAWRVRSNNELDTVTALDAIGPSDGGPGRVFVGTEQGNLFYAEFQSAEDEAQLVPLSSNQHHDGTVTAVRAISRNEVATGGADRSIRLWRLAPDGVRVEVLFLTLRCTGVRLEGVRGDSERRMLEALAAVDEGGAE